MHDFVSVDECEEILAYSWQNMERSTVASKDSREIKKHSKRTGSNTWLQHDASPIIQGVADRISQMVRMPLKNAGRFKLCIIKRMKNTIIIGTVLMNLMISPMRSICRMVVKD